ncbi:MAG TPA: DUF6198 family protein [Ureibacillus sp.]|nr:DUF6198 family protein [Ureibacillus sp.]
MTGSEVFKRYGILTVGLMAMALGVSLSTKADLGTSPISCVPYVLSLGLPWTMGVITFVMHVVFIIIQIILLRRNFQPIQLLQLPAAIIFSAFTDLTMYLVSVIQITNYVMQWVVLLFSFLLVGIGVSFQVKANVVMLAGEGLVSAICKVFRKEFGKVKIYFDSVLVISGVCLSLFMFDKLIGVREGTIVAAVLVGTIVRFLVVRLNFSFFKPKALKKDIPFN